MTSNNLNTNNASYNYKCKSRHIHFSNRYYRKSCIRYQFTAKRRLQQKKAELEKVKNRTYKLLYQHIFLPLEENIIEYELKGTQFIPRFTFDPLNVQCDRYFPEGLKHLRKDIEDFENFEGLKDLINTYNQDVEYFEENKSNELIKEYLEANGFFTEDKAIIPTRMKEIVIPSLSIILKNYWFKKESFHYKWENDYIIINLEPIAKVTAKDKEEFDVCIDKLKEYDKIKEEVENLYCYHNSISKEITKLSEHIRKIIIKIEKETYTTRCSECNS